MIKVIFLSSEANVANLAKTIDIPSGIELTKILEVQQANLEKALSGDEETELIISCGLTHINIPPWKKRLPVVGVSFGPMDIVRLSLKSKEKIGLIAPKSMLIMASELPEYPNIKLFGYEGVATEVLMEAKNAGVSVLAGAEWIAADAEKLGLTFTHAAPGVESLKSAFLTAQLEARWIEREKAALADRDAITNVCRSGIIHVDGNGRILDVSLRAQYFLDCRDKNVIGLYVLNVFNTLEKDVLDSAIVKGEHVFNHVVGTGSHRLMVNIEPLFGNGGNIIRAVIGIHKWEKPLRQDSPFGKGKLLHFSEMKYVSESFKKLVNSAKMVSYTDVPILLRGEPGTEIKTIAQCIHSESHRAKKRFVEIECSVWEECKIEELLFGSFREDVPAASKCLLETADGGTLYFDHIELLPKDAQFRIYRLIQGQYMLNGVMDKRNADLRIIASSQKDLRQMVHNGEFREDLYYALSVARMEVPPLRERPDDIKYILDHFVTKYCDLYQKPVLLSVGAYNALTSFNWPGNSRQLDHFCQRMIFSTTRRSISEAFVRNMLSESMPLGVELDEKPTKKPGISSEAAMIVDALTRNGGSKSKTAEELGMSRTTLWRKMQKYGIITDYST